VNVYACTVIGYLVYTLGQVFLFCFYGNRLIEEVMFLFMTSSNVLMTCYDRFIDLGAYSREVNKRWSMMGG